MRSSAGIIAIIVGLFILAWSAGREPDDGACHVHVTVAPELAERIEIVEWMERPLDRRRHPDGRVEYLGTSGPAHFGAGEVHGNAGVKVTGLGATSHRPTTLWTTVPPGHEMVVQLNEGRMPQISTRPAP